MLRDEFLLDPVTLGSFELALSLHTAAPKIEAYYQFYNTSVLPSLGGKYHTSCETWVYWRGEQICSPDGLERILRQSSTAQRYSKAFLFSSVAKSRNCPLIISTIRRSKRRLWYYMRTYKTRSSKSFILCSRGRRRMVSFGIFYDIDLSPDSH